MRLKSNETRSLVAFILSLLSGLGMLAHGRMVYGRFRGEVSGWGWHRHHWLWERGADSHFSLGWPWVGVVAGCIVVSSAIAFYLSPQYQRSLGTTILIASLSNLFFGVGGMLSSFFGIVGSILILIPDSLFD